MHGGGRCHAAFLPALPSCFPVRSGVLSCAWNALSKSLNCQKGTGPRLLISASLETWPSKAIKTPPCSSLSSLASLHAKSRQTQLAARPTRRPTTTACPRRLLQRHALQVAVSPLFMLCVIDVMYDLASLLSRCFIMEVLMRQCVCSPVVLK